MKKKNIYIFDYSGSYYVHLAYSGSYVPNVVPEIKICIVLEVHPNVSKIKISHLDYDVLTTMTLVETTTDPIGFFARKVLIGELNREILKLIVDCMYFFEQRRLAKELYLQKMEQKWNK